MAQQDNKAEVKTEPEVKKEPEPKAESVKETPKEGRIKIKYNGVIKTINAIELPTWKKNGWETV
jgi:hypothetical protein